MLLGCGVGTPRGGILDDSVLLQTVLILNKCTTFVPLKTGACLMETMSVPTVAADNEVASEESRS